MTEKQMKYIRTKDGIYEFLNNSRITETGLWEVATDCGNEGFFGRFRGEVIKQADIIEELVDEYVCVMPSGETFLLDKNTDLKAQVNYVGDVYGSIWIDGDLHKVAKVSKEGELELL